MDVCITNQEIKLAGFDTYLATPKEASGKGIVLITDIFGWKVHGNLIASNNLNMLANEQESACLSFSCVLPQTPKNGLTAVAPTGAQCPHLCRQVC